MDPITLLTIAGLPIARLLPDRFADGIAEVAVVVAFVDVVGRVDPAVRFAGLIVPMPVAVGLGGARRAGFGENAKTLLGDPECTRVAAGSRPLGVRVADALVVLAFEARVEIAKVWGAVLPDHAGLVVDGGAVTIVGLWWVQRILRILWVLRILWSIAADTRAWWQRLPSWIPLQIYPLATAKGEDR